MNGGPPPGSEPHAGEPALDRWLAEVRADADARARSRVGHLRATAAEDATVVGVLADLTERGATVVVTLATGRRRRARVLLVGPDAVVLGVGGHGWSVVRLDALAAVRTVGGDPVDGEGAATTRSGFARLVGAAAEPGDRVRLATRAEAVSGTVVSISAEVALLRLDGGDACYVPLAAVDEAALGVEPPG